MNSLGKVVPWVVNARSGALILSLGEGGSAHKMPSQRTVLNGLNSDGFDNGVFLVIDTGKSDSVSDKQDGQKDYCLWLGCMHSEEVCPVLHLL